MTFRLGSLGERGGLRVSLQPQGGASHGSEGAGGSGLQQFASVAKRATAALASEFSGSDDAYHRLESWLSGKGGEDGAQEAAPHPSTSSRLLHLAGEVVGVDSFSLDSVKAWLSNPSGAEERDDSHMVGAIVQRLIHAYKAKTGDDFDGDSDAQFDRLYGISKAVLGSGITKSLLRELVKSYLHSGKV